MGDCELRLSLTELSLIRNRLQYSKVQFVQMIPMNVDSMLSNASAV